MDKTSREYAHLYRTFINKLINDIIQEIPADAAYHIFAEAMRSAKQSLAYSAPEILDHSVLKVLNMLRLYVPWKYEESENPQWIINIRRLWTNAIQQIDNGLEIGAFEPEVEAPPQVSEPKH